MQNLDGKHWSLSKVNNKLYSLLQDAVATIYNVSVDKQMNLKEAALAVAMERLLQVR
jgi:glutamate dehydrogenase/leucine dehydrogenase